MPRKKSYVCPACPWEGVEEPTEPQEGAHCPQCGTLMSPEPVWRRALLALVIIGGMVGLVALFAWLRGER